MRLLAGLVALGFLVAAQPGDAKPRANLRARPIATKPAPKAVKPPESHVDPIPPVGSKASNEGAQGRKNATEDAAKAADSPQWEHRP